MGKILYKTGSLLRATEPVIAHGCNARGAFGSGIAGQIGREFPRVREGYLAEYRKNGLKLGAIVWVQSRYLFANCITQPTYGNDGRRHVDYDAVANCMRALNKSSIEGVSGTSVATGFHEVAMPLIGTKLGGGDWSIISAIIERELTDVQPVVYLLDGRIP